MPALTPLRAAALVDSTGQDGQPSSEPDLVDLVIDYLQRVAGDRLPRPRDELEADLRAEFGGQRWYVASRPDAERQRRVRGVLQLFNGRNVSQVARELGISRATVYRVLRQPGEPAGRSAPAPESPRTPRGRPRPAAVVSPLPSGETAAAVRSDDGVHAS